MVVVVEDCSVEVVVREYDPEKDCRKVEEVERSCEVGPSGTISLFTDLMGDPLSRVRHSPAYLMLVRTNLIYLLFFLFFLLLLFIYFTNLYISYIITSRR